MTLVLAVSAVVVIELLCLTGIVPTYRLVFRRDADDTLSARVFVRNILAGGLTRGTIEAFAPD